MLTCVGTDRSVLFSMIIPLDRTKILNNTAEIIDPFFLIVECVEYHAFPPL